MAADSPTSCHMSHTALPSAQQPSRSLHQRSCSSKILNLSSIQNKPVEERIHFSLALYKTSNSSRPQPLSSTSRYHSHRQPWFPPLDLIRTVAAWLDSKVNRTARTSAFDHQEVAPSTLGSSVRAGVARNSIMLLDDAELSFRKWASLAVLVLFTTVTSIVSQRSRSVAPQERYSIAASVFLSELFKLLMGFAVAMVSCKTTSSKDSATLPLFSDKSEGQDHDDSCHRNDQLDSPTSPLSPSSATSSTSPMSTIDRVRKTWSDIYCPSAWMMGVPALIYVLQNMLQLGANSYLSPVAYQGLSQLKLLTAAIISVSLFGKRLLLRQWICLAVLLSGVIFLTQKPVTSQDIVNAAALLGQVEPGPDSPFSHLQSDLSASAPVSKVLSQAMELASRYASAQLAVGGLMVVLACICGSFAGVYIETKLKSSMSVALSVRNAQLASFALVTAGAAVVMEAIGQREWAPLKHFSTLAWITVLLRACSGYIVSATLRYADTIMKGFATSVAIITTIALESILHSQPPSFVQLLGSALVMFSTYNYVYWGAAAKS